MKRLIWETTQVGEMAMNHAILVTGKGKYSVCHSKFEEKNLWSINNGETTEYFKSAKEFETRIENLRSK